MVRQRSSQAWCILIPRFFSKMMPWGGSGFKLFSVSAADLQHFIPLQLSLMLGEAENCQQVFTSLP